MARDLLRSRRASGVGLAALLAGAAACGPTAAEQAEQLAVRGLEAAREDRLEEAVAVFHRASALDPSNLKALYNAGIAHLALGQAHEASAAFEAFVALRPDDAEGLFHLARALALRTETGRSLETLQRAVEAGFADHQALVREAAFQPLQRELRYVALEATVAQRAGVRRIGGALRGASDPQVGGIALPGLRVAAPESGEACAPADPPGLAPLPAPEAAAIGEPVPAPEPIYLERILAEPGEGEIAPPAEPPASP